MYVRMSGTSLGQLLSRAMERNVETWIAMWRSGEICHLPPKYCGSKSGQKAAMSLGVNVGGFCAVALQQSEELQIHTEGGAQAASPLIGGWRLVAWQCSAPWSNFTFAEQCAAGSHYTSDDPPHNLVLPTLLLVIYLLLP